MSTRTPASRRSASTVPNVGGVVSGPNSQLKEDESKRADDNPETTPMTTPPISNGRSSANITPINSPNHARTKSTPMKLPPPVSPTHAPFNTNSNKPTPNKRLSNGRSESPTRSPSIGLSRKETVLKTLNEYKANNSQSASRRAISNGGGLNSGLPLLPPTDQSPSTDIQQPSPDLIAAREAVLANAKKPRSTAASMYSTQRSIQWHEAHAIKRAELQAQQEAEAAAEREAQERAESEQLAKEQADFQLAQERAKIEAEAAMQAEEEYRRFLNDYANFPPAPLFSTDFTDEERKSLLTFLQHSDNTLLSEHMKQTLSLSQISQLYDRSSHFSLEFMLVHLQHLNLTGIQFPNLAALKVGIDFAENHSEEHGGAPSEPLQDGQTKGPINHAGSYSIRRKIYLYLKRKDVKIYPQITWQEVEQLFVLTLAGPRLGAIIYRFDQIGLTFPTFHSLLTHVSEIYGKKSTQHTKNCQTLLTFLNEHQEVVHYEPRTEAEESRPKVKCLALFIQPFQPTLALVKKMMELGLGMSNMVYLIECFLQARYQFENEEQFFTELKRAYAFFKSVVKKAHTFLTSEPRSSDNVSMGSDATNGACILATGPSKLLSTNQPRRRSEKNHPKKSPVTFLTSLTLADAEKLCKESGVLNYTPSSEAGVSFGKGTDSGDDQLLNILIQLNTQVDLQIKPPYTNLDQLITDVRVSRTTRWSLEKEAVSSHPMDGLDSQDEFGGDGGATEDTEDGARERRRRARAKKKGKLTAALITLLREYLLSADCTVLRRKTNQAITDEELHGLLSVGGGTFESVKGHCRQLADQELFVSSLEELKEHVAFSHQMALDQQKQHRQILFQSLSQAGLLDPQAFPSPNKDTPPVYVSDAEKSVDEALNEILYFNTQAQHPHPKSQLPLSNYFYDPLSTLNILKFLIEILQEQHQSNNLFANSNEPTQGDEPSSLPEPLPTPSGSEQVGSVSIRRAQPKLDPESPLELKVKNLTILLHSIHSIYTAYLHAKNQVLDFFHSKKCELKVMDYPTITPTDDSAPVTNGHKVNLLPLSTHADVTDLFEGCLIGLRVLPYLMEINFAHDSPSTKKIFDSWRDLKLTLAQLHARKVTAKLTRETYREELKKYLKSAENRLLKDLPSNEVVLSAKEKAGAALSSPKAATKKSVLTSFEWSDYDLDQLLESGNNSLSTTLLHLRNLNSDIFTISRITSLTILIESLRQAQRMASKHQSAILDFLKLTKEGGEMMMLPINAWMKKAMEVAIPSNNNILNPPAIERLYFESGAYDRTLSYLKSFASQGKKFNQLDELMNAIKLQHAETLKMDNKEKAALSAFFNTNSENMANLFNTNSPITFSDADIASIHTEKMDAPFSLLLLSLSMLISGGGGHPNGVAHIGTFKSFQEFRNELHKHHILLLQDYTKSVEFFGREDAGSRLFDAKALKQPQQPNQQLPPYSSKQVLALFEQLQGTVPIYNTIASWEKALKRFGSYQEMLDELYVQKKQVDRKQLEVEKRLEEHHQIKKLLDYYHILPEDQIKEVSVDEVDGLLTLDFNIGQPPTKGKNNPVLALIRQHFAHFKSEGVTFKSFQQIIRVIQVALTMKSKQFLQRPSPQEQEIKQEEEKIDPHAAATDASQPELVAGRRYVLSAPLSVDANEQVHDETGDHKESKENDSSSYTDFVLPSQKKSSKYILFTPDARGNNAGDSKSKTQSQLNLQKARQELVQQLVELAQKQPWLENTDEVDESIPDLQDVASQRYTLFLALAWPRCHLFSNRTIPLAINDDDLDELLLTCGSGASAVARAIDVIRTLDGEGMKFYDMEGVILEVANRYQRREVATYLSKFGGILSELVNTPKVMSEGFIDDVIKYTNGATHGGVTSKDLDPMLPLHHLLERTQAFFETNLAEEREKEEKSVDDSKVTSTRTITLDHFFQTLSHFAASERRGILHLLLLEGLPPYFETLFNSSLPQNQLSSQLTDRRLDTLLGTHNGSLYRTVRTLKDLEIEDHRFNSVQEFVDGFIMSVSNRKIALAKEQVSSGYKSPGKSGKNAADFESAASGSLTSEDLDDPVTFSRRQAVFVGLSAPQCLLFDARRDHIALTDKDLDEIVEIGGGLPQTLHYLSFLDRAKRKFFTFERMCFGLAEEQQYDQARAYWNETQQNAREGAKDPAKQQLYAEKGKPYRLMTSEKADASEPLTKELFQQMIQAMGGIDPQCTLLSILQTLQRQDGPTLVSAPLFPTREAFFAAIQKETQDLKRTKLCTYLFEPTRNLLHFPTPVHQNNSKDPAKAFCRFEGLSSTEADGLLEACENSLFLALRHCHMLERSGFFFQTAQELLEALNLTQQHLLEEEEDQKVHHRTEDVRAARRASISAVVSAKSPDLTKEDDDASVKPEPHLQATELAVASGTKLHYQSQIGRSGHHGVDYLPPFNPDDDVMNERSMTASTLRGEDQWRQLVDPPALEQVFLDTLMLSDLFSECHPFPTFTSQELDQCLSLVKGDLATFQGSLLELERQHQRYVDSFSFINDLKLLTMHSRSEDLLTTLSFPACGIFSDVTQVVEIDETHLKLLIRAGGNSIKNVKKYIRVLDEQHIKLSTMDELIAIVKKLREACKALKNVKQPGTKTFVPVLSSAPTPANDQPQLKSILKKKTVQPPSELTNTLYANQSLLDNGTAATSKPKTLPVTIALPAEVKKSKSSKKKKSSKSKDGRSSSKTDSATGASLPDGDSKKKKKRISVDTNSLPERIDENENEASSPNEADILNQPVKPPPARS